MQKVHTILAWLLLAFLLFHVLLGAAALLADVSPMQSRLSYVFLALVLVHAALALYKTGRKKKLKNLLAYPKENRLYWTRILSGAAVLALAFVHRTLWTIQTPFGALLKDFEWPSLLAQLLFTAALAVHILCNIRPLLTDSGIESGGRAGKWLRAVFALLMLLAAVGAAVYFVRGAR